MSMTLEGKRSVFLGAQAWLVEEDRETAWAERHVVRNPALKYILGRYVEAEAANDNGHIFDLKELGEAQKSIPNSPLNLLHHPHYIVGNFIASELVYPTEANAGTERPLNAYVEALSAMWRYYFPDEFKEVEKAHNEGSLYYSMECVPTTVTCAAVCGMQYPYDGRQSPTYCDHLNAPAAKKRLGQPHFMGGALILPPAKPGWKGADITELSALMSQHADEAEQVYAAVRRDLPHLKERQWEAMVAQVVRAAMGKGGKAMPDGGYLIETPQDLADAIKTLTQAKPDVSDEVKAHLKRRAKELNREDLLPGAWSS